jgi:hypothetical protein
MPIVKLTANTASTAKLPPAWKKLRPHPVQEMLWRTSHRFCAVAAGRGSGKTVFAKRNCIKQLTKPNTLHFYALPTYRQARRVAWTDLKALIPRHWVKRANETDMAIETQFESTLYVVGLDSPERIEGLQYTSGTIDEASDQRPGIFEGTVRPALTHENGTCWIIGAIKPTGIGVDWFQRYCESAGHVYQSVNGSLSYQKHEDKDQSIAYYNWPSRDILPIEEIALIRKQLDKKTFEAQLEASWATLTGGIFYAFDPTVNVNPAATYSPQHPIAVGSDFNVDPMCWTLAHYINNRLYVFDELFIRNTNTQQTLDVLYQKYPQHSAGWHFFGDATSRSRKTSAVTTDYIQIKNDRRFHGANMFYPKANPPILDRFASANSAFCNAAGENRCFINPACENLIRDLKRRAFKPGTRELADVGDIGHSSDSFSYITYRLFPPIVNMEQDYHLMSL